MTTTPFADPEQMRRVKAQMLLDQLCAAGISPEELVALGATDTQRRGAEADERDPLAAVGRDVAQHPTEQVVTEPVVLVEQRVEPSDLVGAYEAYRKFRTQSAGISSVHPPACTRPGRRTPVPERPARSGCYVNDYEFALRAGGRDSPRLLDGLGRPIKDDHHCVVLKLTGVMICQYFADQLTGCFRGWKKSQAADDGIQLCLAELAVAARLCSMDTITHHDESITWFDLEFFLDVSSLAEGSKRQLLIESDMFSRSTSLAYEP